MLTLELREVQRLDPRGHMLESCALHPLTLAMTLGLAIQPDSMAEGRKHHEHGGVTGGKWVPPSVTEAKYYKTKSNVSPQKISFLCIVMLHPDIVYHWTF